MDFLKHHKIIIVAAALVLVVAVWWGLSSSSAPSSLLTGAPTTVGSARPLSNTEQDLVTTLLTLRAVKLDATIFSDPAFMDLRDFSTEIVPEPVGRPNPFAPLSQRFGTGTTTKTTGKTGAKTH